MKKILKILLILICIGIFILVTITRYVEEEFDVSSRFGHVLNGGAMSTKEYAMISDAYTIYINNMKSGDFEIAYNFLTYEYKQYQTLDDFLIENIEKDFSNIIIKDIIKRTSKLYSVIIDDAGIEKEHMVLYNPQYSKCFIVPDTFIEMKEIKEKVKDKKVEYEITKTTNYLNKYVIEMNITNLNKNKDVNINNVSLVFDNDRNLINKMTEIILKPQETKKVTVEFETYVDFPSAIKFSRKLENNTEKEYFIEID